MCPESSSARRIQSYRDLTVWQQAMDLAVAAHELVRRLRPEVRRRVADQMSRAAGSIAANIAEGVGRLHTGEYLRHLGIANGSLKELETHLELAVRLGDVDPGSARKVTDCAEETGRMLTALIQALGRRILRKQAR